MPETSVGAALLDGGGRPQPLPNVPKFLRSIPRAIALSEAFVAYEMNGQPVPLHHGGPLRLVVPGWYGMASTKWLTHVHARATESDNHFMARGYRYADGSPVDLMRVKSIITTPLDGDQVKAAATRVTGVAWTGAGTVSQVEISSDGGVNWQQARFTSDARPGTWRLWEADVAIRSGGEQRLRARATDSAGTRSPSAPRPIRPATATTRSTRYASMRAEASTWHRTAARCLIASTLVTAALGAGCRTANVGGKTDPDPTMKAIVAPAETAEIAALPDGAAKVLVAERCLTCHSAGLIAQQRKDAAAWGRTVTQMRTWGTVIQDDDQAALVAYLTQHFGPVTRK